MADQQEQQIQHHQVYRVEDVTGILDFFTIGTLPTAVQPDGDQGQNGKTLLGDVHFPPQQRDREH